MKLIKEDIGNEEMIIEKVVEFINDNYSDEEYVDLANQVYWNDGYFDHLAWEPFDDEFFSTNFTDPMEAARATFFGDIHNWNDEYIRFNAYGNLESDDGYGAARDIKDELKDIIEHILDKNMISSLSIPYQDEIEKIITDFEIDEVKDDEDKEDIEESVSDKNTRDYSNE